MRSVAQRTVLRSASLSSGSLSSAGPRFDTIDVLRGFSIVAVILLHIWLRFRFMNLRLGRSWLPFLSHLVWHNGGNGVTVFFAISGFLITFTSLRRFGSLQALQPATFYRIRFARIMPLLLLLLLVLSLLHLAHVEGFVIKTKVFSLPRVLLSALTFHLNWLEAARDTWLPACWTVLWSLSIEEMFYLFFPLICVVVLLGHARVGLWAWFALGIAFVAMGPFARTIWSHTDLEQENSYLAGMSHIAMGCMTAWLTAHALRPRMLVARAMLMAMEAAGWSALALITLWPRWHWLLPILHWLGRSGTDDTLLAFGTCLIMAATVLRGAQGRRWSAPVRWFGRHSYEVYLSHEFVIMAGGALFAHRYPAGASRGAIVLLVLSILGVTAALGWTLAKWFSEPINRWLRGGPLLSA